MTLMQLVKPSGAIAAVALLGFAGMSITSRRVHADSSETDSVVQIGLRIAPVKLNLNGKDPGLVGKGSYIVNAQGLCDECHASPDLGGFYSPDGNPFFGQPKIINPKGYLGGGGDFGLRPGIGSPHIFARNLTPDITGRPEGGATFQEFLTILRTGKDFDHLHPTCPSLSASGQCLSPPLEGDLLQVMPWPIYGSMSDDDIRAIYEYLSAIPCISHAGTPGLPANIYHTCP